MADFNDLQSTLGNVIDETRPVGLLVHDIPPTYKCVCGKDVQINELKKTKTPVLPSIISDVCVNCKNKDAGERLNKESAILVCTHCCRAVRRIAPWTDPISGFKFLPGRYYHITCCPECTGKTGEYRVLEMQVYNRRRLGKQ